MWGWQDCEYPHVLPFASALIKDDERGLHANGRKPMAFSQRDCTQSPVAWKTCVASYAKPPRTDQPLPLQPHRRGMS